MVPQRTQPHPPPTRSDDARERSHLWADTDWPAQAPDGLPSRARAILPRTFGDNLRNASPSIRLVYICLHMGVADSTSELARCSGLPERTVRHAVRWLVDQRLVQRHVRLADTRRVRLRLVPHLPLAAPLAAVPG